MEEEGEDIHSVGYREELDKWSEEEEYRGVFTLLYTTKGRAVRGGLWREIRSRWWSGSCFPRVRKELVPTLVNHKAQFRERETGREMRNFERVVTEIEKNKCER